MRFRIGNIVKAQITVMGVLIKKGCTKMVLHLRSLALLTGSFTELRSQFAIESLRSDIYQPINQRAATDCAKPKTPDPTATIRIVKRRIGYESDEERVHDVRKGIVNMAMNDIQET